MKRLLITAAALFLLILCGCSKKPAPVSGQTGNSNLPSGQTGNGNVISGQTGNTNPTSGQIGSTIPTSGGGKVVYDELFRDSADGVDFIIGRFGDTYLILEDGKTTWASLATGVPSEIDLEDLEFGTCNADMVYLSGGIAGYAHAPTIEKVNGFQEIAYTDVEKMGIIPEYDPKADYFSGPRLMTTDKGTFCAVYAGYRNYRLYKDGRFTGSYDNAYEMQMAMGLVSEGPKDASFEQIHKVDLYVFRCGEEYLAYSHYEGLNWWTPILTEDYKNEPSDFTLENGEVAYLTNAKVVKVNSEDGQYVNAPMILDYENVEKRSLDALSMGSSPDHWEDGPVEKEGEMMEYHASEYLIFYLNGQFHVYKEWRPGDGEEGDVYIGSFDTVKETDQAMGR